MGGNVKVIRASGGFVLLVWFLWFLLAGTLANQATIRELITVSSTRNLDSFKLTGSERHDFHREHNLNYVSKRRVPNGPNPIHNRRAWKSRSGPTRA